MHHTDEIDSNIEVADEARVHSGGNATCEGFGPGIIVSQYGLSLSSFRDETRSMIFLVGLRCRGVECRCLLIVRRGWRRWGRAAPAAKLHHNITVASSLQSSATFRTRHLVSSCIGCLTVLHRRAFGSLISPNNVFRNTRRSGPAEMPQSREGVAVPSDPPCATKRS